MEETLYKPWLIHGDHFKKLYQNILNYGLLASGLLFLVCYKDAHLSLSNSIGLMLLPLIVVLTVSYSYRDKWKDCELKYRRHVPFVDVRKMNVPLASMEFKPGEMEIVYIRRDGALCSFSVPSEKCRVLPSEDDGCYVQTRLEVDNFHETSAWVYCNIYLNKDMQTKFLALGTK